METLPCCWIMRRIHYLFYLFGRHLESAERQLNYSIVVIYRGVCSPGTSFGIRRINTGENCFLVYSEYKSLLKAFVALQIIITLFQLNYLYFKTMDPSKLNGEACILKIFLGESDKINGRPLYEEIVFAARKSGLAGATVCKGIISFGASHSIHTMKIFALSSDLPVTIEIVDYRENLDQFIPILNDMLNISKRGGLVTIQNVDVLHYSPGEKYKNPSS